MPWTTLINTALKLVGFFVNRANLSAEQKSSFLKFMETYKRLENRRVTELDDAQKQLDDLQKKIDSK